MQAKSHGRKPSLKRSKSAAFFSPFRTLNFIHSATESAGYAASINGASVYFCTEKTKNINPKAAVIAAPPSAVKQNAALNALLFILKNKAATMPTGIASNATNSMIFSADRQNVSRMFFRYSATLISGFSLFVKSRIICTCIR